MIMMCGPTWNSSSVPIAWDLLGTQKPPYIYETPTLCTLGVRPATLSLINCRKTWAKRPGSSWADPGKARKTGPPIGASPEKVELTAGRSGPVEHGCVSRNRLWTRPQCGCDLLRIRLRLARCWRLTIGDNGGNPCQESELFHKGSPLHGHYGRPIMCKCG